MKKNYTMFFSIMFAVAMQAQTLTYDAFSGNLLNPENIKIADLATFNPSLLSTAGTGVTWDATSLAQQSGTPVVSLINGDPAQTPNGSLFSNSNFVQYDPALVAFLSYEYYQLSPTAWEKWGDYAPSTEHEIYQNPDKRLQFPFSYGESFVDTYAKTNYSNATTISSAQTGSRTVTFSGYGTLLLPQGTFNNVGLLSDVRTNSLGPDSTTFTWWDITHGKRLLIFSENNGDVNAGFTSDNPLSVSEIATSESIQIFPNPSTGNFRITTENQSDLKNITIYNALGQIIYSNDAPQHTNEVNLSNTAHGICFVSISTADKNFTKKILVQ